VAVGLTALAPHLLWLWQNDFAPFSYAIYIHGAKPFTDTLKGALGYLGGSLGYIAAPLVVAAILMWRSRAPLGDILWPPERDRRLAVAALWAAFLLPAAAALASGTELTSLWSMPNWTLLPVLLLSSPAVEVSATDTRRVLIAAVAFPLIMLFASPLIAINVQRKGPAPAAAHARLLATEIERFWHERTPLPLRFVDGDPEIAYDVVAASVERPHAVPNMPSPGAAELKRSGVVIVCFADDTNCRAAAAARAAGMPGSNTFETEIVRNYFSFPGKPRRYSIVMLPPDNAQANE